jgi:hypothetical protein
MYTISLGGGYYFYLYFTCREARVLEKLSKLLKVTELGSG